MNDNFAPPGIVSARTISIGADLALDISGENKPDAHVVAQYRNEGGRFVLERQLTVYNGGPPATWIPLK